MESSYQPVDNLARLLANASQTSSRVSTSTQWRFYQGALVLLDALCIASAFYLAGWARFSLSLPFFNLEAKPSVPSISQVGLLIIPVWIAIFALFGLYQRRHLLGGLQEYSLVFRATALGMLVIVILGFMRPIPMPARGWVVLAWVFAFFFISAGRFALRRVVYSLRDRGFFITPALIIGENGEAHSLAEQLLRWNRSGLAVVGFVSEKVSVGEPVRNGLQVLGGLESLPTIVEEYGIEEIIIASSALDQDQILTVFKQFGMHPEVTLRLSSGLYEVINTGLEVKEVAAVPLVRVNQARLSEIDQLMKGGLDIVLTLALLFLLSPLLILIALAIRLDSPGPIIYRRRVVGLNGRQFDGLKFRTMVINADEVLATQPELQTEFEQNFKLKDDPRVTEVGRWLRKYSLDELPQLFNVLRREMSIVGPRMIAPEEVAKYERWETNLLTVRPGITGLWQVSGRSDLSYAERVQLDMRYIRNWSIWLDLHILARTVGVVLSTKGAY